MKTILLSTGVLIVAAIAGLLAYATTRPDVFRVERSVSIAASPDKIRPLINDMHAFNSWNPYNRKDPAMKSTYRGPQAGPGAAYDFDGNGEVGKGSLQIIEPSGPDTVSMQLNMIAPMEGRNLIDFRLRPEGQGTRVTWSMHGPTPYVAKVLHVIFDMDKMIGRDFDSGLASLKALAEKA